LSESEKGKARDKAAELVGVSSGYIEKGKQIEQDAPEILEQVKQGKLSIPQAKVDARRCTLLTRQQPKSSQSGRLAQAFTICFTDDRLAAAMRPSVRLIPDP
jgi:hypothetical protein